MYGLRNGAIICVAPTEEIAEEFAAACAYSNRGTWSNGTRGAMQTLADIMSDDNLRDRFIAEQDFHKGILQKRARAFLDEADKIGLKLCNYCDGFFISIPCENPKAVSDLLMEKMCSLSRWQRGCVLHHVPYPKKNAVKRRNSF